MGGGDLSETGMFWFIQAVIFTPFIVVVLCLLIIMACLSKTKYGKIVKWLLFFWVVVYLGITLFVVWDLFF
jgi:hypothetical protein